MVMFEIMLYVVIKDYYTTFDKILWINSLLYKVEEAQTKHLLQQITNSLTAYNNVYKDYKFQGLEGLYCIIWVQITHSLIILHTL